MTYRYDTKKAIQNRDALIQEAWHYAKYRHLIGDMIKDMNKNAKKHLASFDEQYDFSPKNAVTELQNALDDTAYILREIDYIFRNTKYRKNRLDPKPYGKSAQQINHISQKHRDFKQKVIQERAQALQVIADEHQHVLNVIEIFFDIRYEGNQSGLLKDQCSFTKVDQVFNQPPNGFENIWSLAVNDGHRFLNNNLLACLPDKLVEY